MATNNKKGFWLLKSEPESYSIDQLAKDKKTLWTGVRNYLARNFMWSEAQPGPSPLSHFKMRPGDLFVFYHSNANPSGVAGFGEILKIDQVDPEQFDKKSDYFDPKAKAQKPIWYCAQVGFLKKVNQVVALEQLQREPALEKSVLLQKGNRLSVFPLSEAEYASIQKLAGWTPKL